MVGQLLTLGLTQIDKYSLTKEAIELVDKEFAEVNTKHVVFLIEILLMCIIIQITEQVQKAEACFEESHKQLIKLMRKYQSLIPNEKAVAVTKSKQCRLSKLPDVRF